MKMIPPVMANEQGTAQTVNRRSSPSCGFSKYHQEGCLRKSFWKIASERVKIPSRRRPSRTVYFRRVAHFGSGVLRGW